MALKKGAPAPAFSLKSKTADGLVDVALADTAGEQKVVLLFFPFAFTSVCQEELCSVSAGFDEYEKLNAKVYGISVDSPFAQEAFAKAFRLLAADIGVERKGREFNALGFVSHNDEEFAERFPEG